MKTHYGKILPGGVGGGGPRGRSGVGGRGAGGEAEERKRRGREGGGWGEREDWKVSGREDSRRPTDRPTGLLPGDGNLAFSRCSSVCSFGAVLPPPTVLFHLPPSFISLSCTIVDRRREENPRNDLRNMMITLASFRTRRYVSRLVGGSTLASVSFPGYQTFLMISLSPSSPSASWIVFMAAASPFQLQLTRRSFPL